MVFPLALLTFAAARAAEPVVPDLTGRTEITVLIFGDSGKAPYFAPVARAAARACFSTGATPCDMAVLLGDNVYENGMTAPADAAWRSAFARPMHPFVRQAKGPARFRAWVVAGNHDWSHRTDAEGRAHIDAAIATTTHTANHAMGDLWQFPSLAYEVPELPSWLHLYGVDTETLVKTPDTGPLDVVRAGMAENEGWEVVFGHHPPVSTGGHGGGTETDDEVWAAALGTLLPLGLDLVFAGHDHHQEWLDTDGLPVIIQGNSSKGRGVGDTPYAACSRWRRGGEDARGFAIATFRPDSATVAFYDDTGGVVHTVELARGTPTGPVGGCAAPVD